MENTCFKPIPRNKILYGTDSQGIDPKGGSREWPASSRPVRRDEVEIVAAKGVILATGGYAANVKMVMDTNEYWSPAHLTADIKTTNRNLAQGEGLLMGQAVGAALTGMGWTQLMPLGWVDNGNLAGGTGENVIYISPAGTPNAGKRYVDEAAERDVLSQGAFDYGSAGGQYVELSNPGTLLSSAGVPGAATGPANIPGRLFIGTLDEASALLKIDAAVLRRPSATTTLHHRASSKMPCPENRVPRPIGSCEKDPKGNYKVDTYKIDKIMVPSWRPPPPHDGRDPGGHQPTRDHTKGKDHPRAVRRRRSDGRLFAGNRLGGNAVMEIIVSGRVAGEAAAKGK
jgi:fumarate reductase flavoprotein subunit